MGPDKYFRFLSIAAPWLKFMSITKFGLILKRATKQFKLSGNITLDGNIPEYYFLSKNGQIWNEALAEGFQKSAARFKDKVFLPQKSLCPMAVVNTNDEWEFKLSQFGIPFCPIKTAKFGEEINETVDLIPRGKCSNLHQKLF